MADAIKTKALKALKTVLQEIPELKVVVWGHPIGTDLETLSLPALFFWDDSETREPRNRLVFGRLRVEMAAFIKLRQDKGRNDAFHTLADTIAGKVHEKVRTSPALGGLIIQAEEETLRKAIGNEAFGELVLIYTLTYGHRFGDAFSQSY